MTPFYVALIALASIIFLSNRYDLNRQISGIHAGSIPLIYAIIIVVTILHELSHGYACKMYGGQVHEMGILLQYFFVLFYTNISDAYLFPDKKKRMSVTTVGLTSQIIIWAMAVLVWRIMAPETIFSRVSLIIVTLSTIGIFFNCNPLLKLDAYYYFVDRWGIPNLRARAFGYWKSRLFHLISRHQVPASFPEREVKIYTWYGLAAIVYSAGLFGYLIYKLSGYLFDKTGVMGLALLYMVMVYMIYESAKKAGFWKVLMSERGNILKPRNYLIASIAVIGIVLLSAIIRIELKISQDCLIYPIEQLTIQSDESGTVELMLDRGSGEKHVQRMSLSGDLNIFSIEPVVVEGETVARGDLVARITSSESESHLVESRANLDRAQYQLELLRKGPRPEEIDQTEDLIQQVTMKLDKSNSELARSIELSAKGMIPKEKLESDRTANEVLKSELSFYQRQKRLLKQGARPEEISIAEADIRAIGATISRLESQLEANNIRSPIDGIITAVKAGSDIITVARTDTMRVRIPVPENEIGPVMAGQVVKLKVRGYPGETFEGRVTRISGQTESGSGVSQSVSAGPGSDGPVFVVTAEAGNAKGLMKPGMTGRAKIYCGKLPIYKVLLWRVVRWFRVEFWSWF
jgi:multidrug efflux pump subunit AcrA (membrane-fusion protein)